MNEDYKELVEIVPNSTFGELMDQAGISPVMTKIPFRCLIPYTRCAKASV